MVVSHVSTFILLLQHSGWFSVSHASRTQLSKDINKKGDVNLSISLS